MAQAQGSLTGPIYVLTYRLMYRVSLTRHLAWRVFFECRSATQNRLKNSFWLTARARAEQARREQAMKPEQRGPSRGLRR